MTERHQGKIKWFNAEKGFGFIVPDDEADAKAGDVFVHITELEKIDAANIKDGQPIEYELDTYKGRTRAVNLYVNLDEKNKAASA